MTLVIPDSYIHVVESLQWEGDPEPMAITYAVQADAGSPWPDGITYAGALGGYFDDNIMPLMNQIITHLGTDIVWQNGPDPEDKVVAFAESNVNGSATDATVLPQNCALLVHKRSASAGRSGRGRFYLPGCAEDDCDNLGNVRSPVVGAYNGALNLWLGDIVADAGITFMCILHDSEGAAAADTPNPVTSLNLDTRVATQRFRLRR